jgi:hypothetical protein
MTTRPTPELFFDTVTLANFALARRLDLLRRSATEKNENERAA